MKIISARWFDQEIFTVINDDFKIITNGDVTSYEDNLTDLIQFIIKQQWYLKEPELPEIKENLKDIKIIFEFNDVSEVKKKFPELCV